VYFEPRGTDVRNFSFPFWVPIAAAIVSVAACSAPGSSRFGVGGSVGSGANGTGNGTGTGNGSPTGSGASGLGGGFGSGAGNGTGGSAGPCEKLECQAMIDACSSKGKSPTTITGYVYDPAGAVPLYNVYVYIPNDALSPIAEGNPTCTQCEAPASGNPVVGALTDYTGKFVLDASSANVPHEWGVPSGANIPLVLQVGKWRRQVTIPMVTACEANAQPDPSTPANKLRLPAKTSEGSMPLIAFTSGCDPAECFLRHIGIDDSEFVAPGGNGHVHFYTGQDASGGGDASMVNGGNASTDTYQWWTSSANLLKYDIIFNACECNPNDRGASAYPAMEAYLNGGGRLFATHYYYNWFAPSTGPADFQSVVNWVPGIDSGFNTEIPNFNNYYIDQGFPKGQAFAKWLQNAGVTQTLGFINLTDTRYDMDTVTSKATDWIYNANSELNTASNSNYSSMYMSFNAPTTAAVAKQCGRAVFSDVHLSGSSDDSTFPNECQNADPGGSHAVNEKALEFLFFDLSSCVQDNSKPPPPPPPIQ
jgi:hypothetical protein